MTDPLNLTQIGIRHLSNFLLPLLVDQPIYIPELACLSPRLGNMLLESFIEHMRPNASICSDHFLSLFNNTGRTKRKKCEVIIQLTELHFRSCSFITNQSISKHLLAHELIETIDLRDCNISYTIFNVLSSYFPRLISLYLGTNESKSNPTLDTVDFFPAGITIDSKCCLIKPKLKLLAIEGIHDSAHTDDDRIDEIFYNSLMQSSEHVRHLDLSRNSAIESLNYIDCFKQIYSLILYDLLPDAIERSIDSICRLKTLALLDLSYNRRVQEPQNYTQPTLILGKLIHALPRLVSLDISGTNLAGSIYFDPDEELAFLRKELSIDDNEVFTVQSSIPGLLILRNELEFLGLFDVDESASARLHIPAKKVTGEHTEAMLMTSLSHYMERPNMLTHVMAHLFRLYNHHTIQNPLDAGKLVMDGMEKHLYDRSLQTSGSACLYYVVDMFQNEPDTVSEMYNDYLKRLLLTILKAMHAHLQHSPMIRNGLLTISRMQMHLPNHIMSAFEQTVNVLIDLIQLYLSDHVTHEQILLHNALSVLNHVACSVDGQEKLFIGQTGAIETAMGIIRRFLSKKINCEIVEVAWTLLWNITDETPENCRRFVEDNDGLQTFHDCLELWPDKRDLIRNMLGLLGNVAEVKELRPFLVTPLQMEKFRILVKGVHQNDIEIPYNCGGILANILSDGPEAWTIDSSIKQEVVNQEIFDAVQTWDLRRPRTINYRSLTPIIRLLNENNPTGCVIWTVWALTNLTTVLPDKYCGLLHSENGEPLLRQILLSEKMSEPIKTLAEAALANVQRFLEPPTLMDLGADE